MAGKVFQVAFEIGAKLGSQFSGAFSSANSHMMQMQQQLAKLNSTQGLIHNFEKLSGKTTDLQNKFQSAKQEVLNFQKEIGAVGVPTKKMVADIAKAQNEAGKLASSLTMEQEKLKQTSGALKAAGVDTKNLYQSQSQLQQQITKTAAQQAKYNKLLNAQKSLRASRENVEQSFGSVRNTALSAAGFSYMVGKPIQQAAEAEYQQQLIANTVGLTKQQQIELNQKVAEYSKLTNQTQGDLTKGVGFLTAAGMDYSTAINMLGTMGKTATATGSNIEDVAKTLYAVNSNLKITASEGAAAMDAVLIASKEGNVEFKDMAAYLPTVTAGAASLGITGQKGLAALAAGAEVARIGAGSAEEAFNNQKNFLQKITSKEFVTNAAKMGINMKDQIQKGLASGDLLGYLTKFFKDLTKGDKFKTSALFTDMQAQGYINAQMQNYDKYIAIRDKALNGGGEVDKDAGKMMSTTQEQMKALQIRMQETVLILGKSLMPAFQSLIKSMQPYIEAIGSFIQEHPKVTVGLVAISAGFFALKIGLGVGALIKDVAVAFKLATVSAWLFNAALWANPVTWIIGGVVALTGALYLFFTKTELGRKAWSGLTAFISFTLANIKNDFMAFVNLVSSSFDTIAKLYNGAKSFLGLGGNTTVTANMQHLIPQQNANGLGNKLASANQQLAKQSQNNSKTNNNTQHITYSPSIVIQGNADKSQVQQAMTAGLGNFDEMMRNKYRLSY